MTSATDCMAKNYKGQSKIAIGNFEQPQDGVTTRNMRERSPGMDGEQRAMAERLRVARKLAGYSDPIDFYSAFDLSQSSYSHHENGTRALTRKAAKRYAELLGNVSSAWLLTGEGEPPKEMPQKSARGKRSGAVQAEVGGNAEKELLDEQMRFLWEHFGVEQKVAVLRVMEAISLLVAKKAS